MEDRFKFFAHLFFYALRVLQHEFGYARNFSVCLLICLYESKHAGGAHGWAAGMERVGGRATQFHGFAVNSKQGHRLLWSRGVSSRQEQARSIQMSPFW